MTCDKLVGPRVKLILAKLVPPAIVDQMRDSPGTAVHMYQANHENPELIWTDESRQHVSRTISNMVEE